MKKTTVSIALLVFTSTLLLTACGKQEELPDSSSNSVEMEMSIGGENQPAEMTEMSLSIGEE